MKGQNKLHMNKATMIIAIQEWADRNFRKPVRVVDVTWLGTNSSFEISMDEVETEQDPE